MTVSALLVVVSGVLLRGSARLANIDLGLRTRDVIEVRTLGRGNTVLAEALTSSPLVRGIGATSHSTFSNRGIVRAAPIDTIGVPERRLHHRFASPGYFEVVDLDIVSGRPFTESEARTEAPVVILSQDAASLLWPGENPVGRPIRLSTDVLATDRLRRLKYSVAEVIGVARQVSTSWDPADRPTVYLPTSVENVENTTIMVRTPASVRQLDALIAAGAPGLAEQLMPTDELGRLRLYLLRAAYWLSGGIGVIALMLTISGVYGVLAYAVARRTREIGIRVALGASSASIVSLVVRQSLRLCIVGLAIGVALALGVSALLASELVMMKPFDVVAYGAGIAVVLAACLTAALSPARAATRIEPLHALRIE